MSNAIVVPDTFKGPVASVFQGQQAGDDLSGGITGGYALLKYRGKVWSIQHNGENQNLMREDGDGPRGSVDIVIVKANAQMSKTFYINGWDENNSNPPDCASANGIVPDQGVPHKQAEVCAMCPKNAWGSAPNGGKGKACGDHRRLAIVPLTDLRNEFFGGPMLLRCPAASLQDMAAFDARYKSMGYPYFTMGIKVAFDPQESYPKFTFAAIRPLTNEEGQVIMELRNSPLTARVISEGSAPAAAPAVQQSQPAFLEAPPANAIQPQQVAVQPATGSVTVAAPATAAVAQPAPPAAAPAPVAEPVRAGPAGANAGPATGSAGGFGPAVRAAPASAAAQPAGAAPQPAPAAVAQPAQVAAAQPAAAAARTMTGFGPVTPEVTPQPAATAQPVAAPAVQTAPGVVSEFEGSIDDRLASLLNSSTPAAS